MGLDRIGDTEGTTTINAGNENQQQDESSFHWTAVTVLQALALMILAGFAEIGGGWMIWQVVRGDNPRRPWWWGALGSAILVAYGFIVTLQPTDSFGRIYAVYGVFFIALSFLAGWVLDGERPDLGDLLGGTIALAGGLLILFWPR